MKYYIKTKEELLNEYQASKYAGYLVDFRNGYSFPTKWLHFLGTVQDGDDFIINEIPSKGPTEFTLNMLTIKDDIIKGKVDRNKNPEYFL